MRTTYLIAEIDSFSKRVRTIRIRVFDSPRGWRRTQLAPGVFVTNAGSARIEAFRRWWIVAAVNRSEAYGAVRGFARYYVNLRGLHWHHGRGKVLAHGGVA